MFAASKATIARKSPRKNISFDVLVYSARASRYYLFLITSSSSRYKTGRRRRRSCTLCRASGHMKNDDDLIEAAWETVGCVPQAHLPTFPLTSEEGSCSFETLLKPGAVELDDTRRSNARSTWRQAIDSRSPPTPNSREGVPDELSMVHDRDRSKNMLLRAEGKF